MAAGVHSLLAFWIGGAGRQPPQGSVRSLLAFWAGGAAAGPAAPPVAPPVQTGAVGPPYQRMRQAVKRPRRIDDEEIFALIWAALHVLEK